MNPFNLVIASLLGIALPANAATSEWRGVGPDNLWTTGANWDTGVAPSPGDDLVFPAGAALSATVNDFPDGTSFQSILVEESGYSMKGNLIELTNGVTYTTSTPGDCTWNLSFKLNGGQSFVNDSPASGILIFINGNTVDLGGDLTLEDSGTTGARFRFNATITGGGGLVVRSQIALNGPNSFTGAVDATTQTTTIEVGDSSAFGPGGLTTMDGCTITIPGSTPLTVPEAFLIQGDQNYLTGSGAPHTTSGNITFTNNSRLFAGGIGQALRLTGVLDWNVPQHCALRTAPGNTTLIIAGSSPNIPGPDSQLYIDVGDVRFAKTLGVNAGARENRAVTGQLIFDVDNQCQSWIVSAYHPGIINLNGTTQNVGLLYMSGGFVQTNAGILLPENIKAEPGLTNPAALIQGSGQVRVPASGVMAIDAAAPPFTAGYPTLDIQCGLTQTTPGSVVTHNNIGLVTYSGSSNVYQLRVPGAAEARIAGNYSATLLQIEANGFLSGTGSTGPVTQLAPFNFPQINPGILVGQRGVLTVGNLSLPETSVQCDIRNTLPSVDHDKLVAQGTVDLASLPQQSYLLVSFQPGHVDIPGRDMVLVDNDGADPVTGTFFTLPEGALSSFASAMMYRITYLGGDGNDIVLRSMYSVPTGNTAVWDAGGANQRWTNPLNWVGDVAPTPGDKLEFPVNTHATPTNDYPAGTCFHGITVTTTGITFVGNRVTLTDSIAATTGASGYQSAMPVTLAADVSFITNGGVCQWLPGGDIDLQTHTLTFAGVSTAHLIDSLISGTGNLIHAGPNELYLNAANTHTGTTSVSPGAFLTIGHQQGLGSTAGATHVASGGRVYIGTQLSLFIPSMTVAEPFVLAGPVYVLNNGAHTLTGTITSNTPGIFPAVYNGGASLLTITGTIDGTGDITLGAGFFSGGIVLNGTNATTLTGTMFISTPVRFAKNGVPSAIGRIEFVNGPLTVSTPGQIAPTCELLLQYTQSYLIIDGVTEDITDIRMQGGYIETINGGLLVLDRQLRAGAIGGATNLISGSVQLRGALHGTPGNVDFIVDYSGAAIPDLDISGVISNAAGASMVRSGSGKMVLAANNTFTQFTGNAAASGPEGLTIFEGQNNSLAVTQNSGVIGGGGFVSVINGTGGFVAPGGSPGQLTCGKFGSAPTLRVELNAPGSNDVLKVTQTADFSASGLQLVLPPLFTPPVGSTYLIVNNDSPDPTIESPTLWEGAHINAGAGRIFQITCLGGDGNDVVLTAVAASADGSLTGVISLTPSVPGSQIALVGGLGLPGLFYTIQSSPDLITWTTHSTQQADPGGVLSFSITQPINPDRRFYRLTL